MSGARRVRSETFTTTEVQALLRCARFIVPTTESEWEAVWTRYRATFAKVKHRAVRSAAFLLDKFEGLTAETGVDPSPEALEAREIQALIDAKLAQPAPQRGEVDEQPRHSELGAEKHRRPQTRVRGAAKAPEDKPTPPERKQVPFQADSPPAQTPSPPKHLEGKPESHDHASTVAGPLKPSVKRSLLARPMQSPKKRRVETVVPTLAEVEEATERVILKMQLRGEKEERQRLQQRTDMLEMKMDDLRDAHRKELDKLRNKNIKLRLKLNRVLGALTVLRAAQPPPASD